MYHFELKNNVGYKNNTSSYLCYVSYRNLSWWMTWIVGIDNSLNEICGIA